MTKKAITPLFRHAIEVRTLPTEIMATMGWLFLLMMAAVFIVNATKNANGTTISGILGVWLVAAVAAISRYLSGAGSRQAFLKMLGNPVFNYRDGIIFERAEGQYSGVMTIHRFPSNEHTTYVVSALCYIHTPVVGGYSRSRFPELVLFYHVRSSTLNHFAQGFGIGSACRVSNDPDANMTYEACELPKSVSTLEPA